MLTAMDENLAIDLSKKIERLMKDPSDFSRNKGFYAYGMGTMEWFFQWEQNIEDFAKVFDILYRDQSVCRLFRRMKQPAIDFLEAYKKAKCEKVNRGCFDGHGNLLAGHK